MKLFVRCLLSMGFSFRETHQPQESPQISSRSENNYLADITELQKLKDLILQRDNEISILFFIDCC